LYIYSISYYTIRGKLYTILKSEGEQRALWSEDTEREENREKFTIYLE